MTLVVRPWCRTWYVMSWHWVHTSVWSWHGNEPILRSTVCLIWMGLDICLYDSPYCGLELPAWYIIVDIIVLTYAIDELHARYLVTHQVIVHTMDYTSTWWLNLHVVVWYDFKVQGFLGVCQNVIQGFLGVCQDGPRDPWCLLERDWRVPIGLLKWSKGCLVFVRTWLECSNGFVKIVQGVLGVC